MRWRWGWGGVGCLGVCDFGAAVVVVEVVTASVRFLSADFLPISLTHSRKRTTTTTTTTTIAVASPAREPPRPRAP